MAISRYPSPKNSTGMSTGMTGSREDWRLAESTSCLEVNLPAIEHNARTFLALGSAHGKKAQLCAVIKKNAYGLGSVQVANRMVKAGVTMLAVYSAEEAIELINANIVLPILLLMPFERLTRNDNVLYRHAVQGRLHVALHDAEQLERFNDIGRDLALRMPIHLHLDTGMSRGGFQAQELSRLIKEEIPKSKAQVVGLYTHLASSDIDPQATEAQVKALKDFYAAHQKDLPADTLLHAANTCAALRDPDHHLDMMRIGLGLTGIGPEVIRNNGLFTKSESALRPTIVWKSRVIHAALFPAGSTVGYQSTHRLAQDTPLGLVPVGYGDGYPPSLANKGVVRVRKKGYPPADCQIRGLVNMDQIVVDLTPALAGGAAPMTLKGAEVEVISADADAPNTLAKFAEAAGIHPYGVLCGISARVPRKYIYQD